MSREPLVQIAAPAAEHLAAPPWQERLARLRPLLRALGFRELRVRHHGEVARVEVPLAELARLIAPGVRERVVEGLKALGFRYVALDLEGFRSGSLNASLSGRSGDGRQA